MDPICTYFFAIIVLWTTKKTFWQCLVLILETVPSHLNINSIKKRIEDVDGVTDVHDMHIWSLSQDKYSFTCHVVIDKSIDG